MKRYLNPLIALVLSVFSLSAFAAPNHYVIFVDAGSSGSRLHIFQYDDSKPSMPVVHDLHSKSIKPGLSFYAPNPDQAGQSLKPALDDAVAFLQGKTDIKTVAVNVFGTGGMRSVTKEQEAAIYASVRAYLKNHYSFAPGSVQTILGSAEGLYGWLDVNYLSGNFQNCQPTIGSIDMGGASTQIAFETQGQPSPDLMKLNINGQKYIVFSKSFLGFGQDAIQNSIIKDPQANTCFPLNYEFQPGSFGNFNYSSCGWIYEKIIKDAHIGGQILPTSQKKFIAYSGIYYTYNFFNVDKTPEQAALEKNATTVCSETWDQLQKDYPTVAPQYLSTYCSNAAYQDELLYYAYFLQGSNQLTVLNQIYDKDLQQYVDIDWPLGAALYTLLKQ